MQQTPFFGFVDYEKAFESAEHSELFNLLWEQSINENSIKVIEYNNSIAIIGWHKDR